MAAIVVLSMLVFSPALARNADGTLGLIRRPASTHPVLVLEGDLFEVRCDAPPDASAWWVELILPETSIEAIPLSISDASYDPVAERWLLGVVVPLGTPEDLYDLRVSYDAGTDTNRIAVKVLAEWPTAYSFAHYSDTQNLFATPGITPTMEAIIADLNVLQPAFAIVTGDLVTYGQEDEYRDYLDALETSRVPTFHIPGNHDIFWVSCFNRDMYQERYERFIGDRNYTFDFGPHHFAGFELSGYEWLCPYAALSGGQISWLEGDLVQYAGAPLKVLFGHQTEYDSSTLETLAADYGVDMYLYGHIHNDAVDWNGSTTFAAVGWAGDGLYRMIRVENDAVSSFTYAGDPVAAIPGGDALSLELVPGSGDEPETTVVITNPLDQSFPDVSVRVEMPPAPGPGHAADGGEVWQEVLAAETTYVYVRGIDVAAQDSTNVWIYALPDEPLEPEPDPELEEPVPEEPADVTDPDEEIIADGCTCRLAGPGRASGGGLLSLLVMAALGFTLGAGRLRRRAATGKRS